jgi:hypothetical protein
MSKQVRYVDAGDIPDDEPIYDSQGRLVDDAYVEQAVEEAREYARRVGRPSLSESGESPVLHIRVPHGLERAIGLAAEIDHTPRSEWVRRTLARATAQRLAKRQ